MNNLGPINILLLILIGCSGFSIPDSPDLDKLLNASTKSVVNINSVESEQITPDLAVAGKKSELDEYLARPVSSVLTKEYILTADQRLNSIAVSNLKVIY